VEAARHDCRDVADNKYLELAIASDAAAIVTGDQDLLILNPWRGIRVLPPVDYLSLAPAPDPGR
jgi:uncharacterized protein